MTPPTPSEVLAEEIEGFLKRAKNRDQHAMLSKTISVPEAEIILTVLRAGQPEGMVLVPREPTDVMCLAGLAKVDKGLVDYGVDNVYRAMLAAASSGGKGTDSK